MNEQAPVGIFDSGWGGLSVLHELRLRLPAEDLLYYADSAYCPYGTRSAGEIRQRSEAITGALQAQGAKLIVVACNTASSVAIDEVRARSAVPIVGMEPAVKPAVGQTRTGKIGVLATPRTAGGDRLAQLIARHANGTDVMVVPAPGLVELVEAGTLSGERVRAILQPLLSPLLGHGIDTLVLGCTHYPFLREEIAALTGPAVTLVDSGEAIARRTRTLLEQYNALHPGLGPGSIQLLTSGEPAAVAAVATHLLGQPATPIRLPV